MSESEVYMQDSNEGYDLPRWQTQVDPISSTAQAQNVGQTSYHYPGPPPPPPQTASQQRIQTVQGTAPPTKQPRISQLLEQEQQYGASLSAYSSGGQSQLSRSASLGGSAAVGFASTRLRRHHPPDDLEGAFSSDNHNMIGARQQPQLSHNYFYPPSVGYQSQSLSTTGTANTVSPSAESYSDMYFNNSTANPPKRLQPVQQETNANRGGRSPLRVPISASPLDFSQQTQYSPTTSASFAYGVDTRPHPTTYQSHSRNHSQIKTEPATPPLSTSYSYAVDQRSQPTTYPTHTRDHSQVKVEATTPPVSTSYSSQTPNNSYTPGGYASTYSMDTSSPHPSIHSHLGTQAISIKTSLSTPSTPMSYVPTSATHSSHYYPHEQAMVMDPPPKRRPTGFRRVRTPHDLHPKLDAPNMGRRMGQDGTYLSPLRQLTTNIVDTYRICNPQFHYESTHNPRRVLTKPSKPTHNDGYDNEDYDYILYVNDWLGTEDGHKYLILDILGQGTFGQVVKCQNMKTHEIVAVKVVKNKPAYFNQSMMEVTILELLNKQCDPNDEHHILRLRDSFIHRSHLCLVFELLSSNLYELIKQNQFQGLSTQLVKVFMAQLLDALTVLKEARLIHCDLKPENILLKSLQSPQIKVIDFGSACHERQTVYTYIQSRFYRSPEVLLGMPYNTSIDMWSLGCIAVELFLGLPLFPGTSEYNQLTRIIDMLGMPPLSMLNTGKQSGQFFDSYDVWNPHLNQNEKKYRLKSIDQYSREHNTNEQPGKQYFKANSLPDIINQAPMPASKSSRSAQEIEKELNNRAAFVDFCQGLLNLNPVTRWTPQQARLHPFITGEKFSKPFVPDGLPVSPTSGPDPKRPYGGLVPSQPKGTRAFADAASYNHHLAQHQAYTAQAQSQAANTFRNPYINTQTSQHAPTNYNASSSETVTSAYQAQQPPPASAPQYITNLPPVNPRTLTHQSSTGHLGVAQTGTQQYAGHSTAAGLGTTHLSPNVPANPYIPSHRARANTINQMDSVPPALARLQHMNQDVIGGRNALTPVLNRDDAMREWERRQQGKAVAAQPYPQLEYLQQQAELAASSGLTTWGASHSRYPAQPSKLSHSFQPTMMVEDDNGSRRDAVLSNVRSGPNVIPSSNQSYPSNVASTSANRFPANYNQNPAAPAFDSIERRTDMGNMYAPMHSDPYSGYNAVQPPSNTARHITTAGQPVGPPSFYGSSVLPSGQMNPTQPRNAYIGDGLQATNQASKEVRRNVDTWAR